MSAPETQAPVEQHSSIKVVRNAKGDPQWEVKVLVGEDEQALDEARRLAIRQHEALARELR